MAGASIPLTPAVHQMIDIGPVPRFLASKTSVEFPIVRDMDTNMYERQDGQGLEVGSYAHRPILHEPDEIPSIAESALSPDRAAVHAGRLRAPDGAGARADAGDRRRRVRRDQVRDQRPALAHARRPAAARRDARGEGPLVGGRRVGQGGPGRRQVGRRVDGARRARDRPPVVRHRALLRRAAHAARTSGRARRRASTRRTGSSTRPSSGSRTAASACRRSTRASASSARSSSRRPPGSGRTGTSRTRKLLEEFGDRITARGRVGVALVVADHQRRAPRDARARRDVRPDGVLHLRRRRPRRARRACSGSRSRQMDVAVGRVVYTPVLSPGGGFRSDLTIMRLGDEQFRVVTGGAHGMADLKWFADHLPADGARRSTTSRRRWCTLGLWGPRARDILASVTSRRRLARGLPVRHLRDRRGRRRCDVLASRISYVGDLGWELYVPIEQGARALGRASGRRVRRTASSRPGSASTARPAGSRSATARSASSSTPTTTSSRRAWRGGKVKDAGLRRQGGAPAPPRGGARGAILCTLTVDDHTSTSGRQALHARPRADARARRRRRSSTRKGRRSYVTSAGAGPSIGKHILMSYLPPRARDRGRAAARSSTWASATRSRSRSSARRRSSTRRTRGSAREDPRLRQARPDHRRAHRAHRRRAVDRTRGISASRSARTRSARSRRRCGIVEAHGGEVGRADARAGGGRGADARLHGDRRRPRDPPADRRRGVGRAGDGGARSSTRSRGDGDAVRPDPVRQRVGRRGQLPGRDPGRVRARPAGRERAEGDRRRRARRCAASARRRAAATCTRSRCRPC